MKFKTKLKPAIALIDMTPLVDVIFLLLIFFIITSDILPLKSLNIENPRLPRDSLPVTTQLPLVMDAQHVIYVGSKKSIVDLASLKDHLEEEIRKIYVHYPDADPVIALSIDQKVDYGTFLQLFSIAQQCCSRVRLVYRPEEDI